MGMPTGKTLCGRAYFKYKGPYDWDGMYKLIWNWLANRGYEVQDKRYKHKITSTGNELKVNIGGELRETDYVKRFMDLKIRTWHMNEKETEVNGQKKIMADGRIWIEIVGNIQFDWQGIFKGSWIKKLMGEIYYWARKKEMEQIYADDHEYEVIRLETEIKKLIGMETSYNAFENSN